MFTLDRYKNPKIQNKKYEAKIQISSIIPFDFDFKYMHFMKIILRITNDLSQALETKRHCERSEFSHN